MEALQFNVTTPKFVAAKGLKKLFGNKVFFKGPARTVGLVDVPEPYLISNEWVKLETCLCGFCGSDLNLMLLHDSPTASPFSSFPCVPGHEIVARIIETGSGADGFETGDLVVVNPLLGCRTRDISALCQSCLAGRPSNCENFARGSLAPGMFLGINKSLNGGFAPRLVAHKSQLHKVPSDLSMESAVMAEPVAVSLQAVFDNLPDAREKILVIGGGVIGNLIVQSARALVPDCDISVIEPAVFAAEKAMEAGADRIIPRDQVFAQSAAVTSGTPYKPLIGMELLMGGFNRIFDTVGNSATLNLSTRLLTAFGTLSVVGIGGNVNLDLTPLWLKLQNIKGVYAYGQVNFQGKSQNVFDVGLGLMAQGTIAADTLVTHKFPLKQWFEMIQVNLDKGKHKAMKTVVTF